MKLRNKFFILCITLCLIVMTLSNIIIALKGFESTRNSTIITALREENSIKTFLRNSFLSNRYVERIENDLNPDFELKTKEHTLLESSKDFLSNILQDELFLEILNTNKQVITTNHEFSIERLEIDEALKGNRSYVIRNSGLLNERIARLDLNTSKLSDIIDIFGEPLEYSWGSRVYLKNNLPDYYFMKYPNGLSILMNVYSIVEISILSIGYIHEDILEVGSGLEDVLIVLGEPDQIISGQSSYFEDGILYKNINNEEGSYYYERKELGLRIFLKDNLVYAIYLMPVE